MKLPGSPRRDLPPELRRLALRSSESVSPGEPPRARPAGQGLPPPLEDRRGRTHRPGSFTGGKQRRGASRHHSLAPGSQGRGAGCLPIRSSDPQHPHTLLSPLWTRRSRQTQMPPHAQHHQQETTFSFSTPPISLPHATHLRGVKCSWFPPCGDGQPGRCAHVWTRSSRPKLPACSSPACKRVWDSSPGGKGASGHVLLTWAPDKAPSALPFPRAPSPLKLPLALLGLPGGGGGGRALCGAETSGLLPPPSRRPPPPPPQASEGTRPRRRGRLGTAWQIHSSQFTANVGSLPASSRCPLLLGAQRQLNK